MATDYGNLLKRINFHQHTNYYFLKPKQWDALQACATDDVLTILPTGYGKTIIIQALPFLDSANIKTIVISNPLNAIIHEQKKRFGDSCIVIDSVIVSRIKEYIENKDTNSAKPNIIGRPVEGTIQRLLNGDVTYIVSHPEHLQDDAVKIILKTEPLASKISHLVVDESHSVITWGKNFRPALLQLGSLRAILPKARLLALTATTTRADELEIVHALLMNKPVVIRESPDRPNLFLQVKNRPPSAGGSNTVEQSYDTVVDPILEQLKQEGRHFPRTIMYMPLKWCGYVHHRAITTFLSDHPEETTIQRRDINQMTCLVAQFHAPQTRDLGVDGTYIYLNKCSFEWLRLETIGMKDRISDAMKEPDSTLRLLLCTEAYSMGADPAKVREVVHIGLPNNIETYIQEIGRGGRDGSPSTATLYYNNADVSGKYVSHQMKDYCKIKTCRRKFLMDHFQFDLKNNRLKHSCCDNCRNTCDCDTCASLASVSSASTDSKARDTPSELRNFCYCSLTHYFSLENSTIDSVFSEAISGLSDNLATTISKAPFHFSHLETLSQNFRSIKDTYIRNISQILKSEIHRYEILNNKLGV